LTEPKSLLAKQPVAIIFLHVAGPKPGRSRTPGKNINTT